MISKLKQKIDSLIGTASGYTGIIFINLSILALVLGLFFVQYNWVSKEKKALKSMIDKQREKAKIQETALQKNSQKKLIKESIAEKKRAEKTNEFLHDSKKITKANITHIIKKADMYFDYDQYDKAVDAYTKVINSEVTIDESDRIFSRLAECYYKMERYERAIELYRKVSNDYLHSPYRLSAQLGLGECLIVTGDYDEARRVLYKIAAQEARYSDETDKNMVVEAQYKIAESYIAQAKHSLKEVKAGYTSVVVR